MNIYFQCNVTNRSPSSQTSQEFFANSEASLPTTDNGVVLFHTGISERSLLQLHNH